MAHPPTVNITSATPPASNEERRALPLHAIPGKNLPDPPTRTSQSSMESGEGVNGQHNMTTRELQEILMKTNVYDENDPIVKKLQEKRKSSNKK